MVETAITIEMRVAAVYAYWRDFTNLPTFMEHLAWVRVRDERTSRWKVKEPDVEWETEIVEEVQDRRIAWRARQGLAIVNEVVVNFIPTAGGQRTEVMVWIHLPEITPFKALIAKLLGTHPVHQANTDLQRLKRVLERPPIVQASSGFDRSLPMLRPLTRSTRA